MRKTFLPRRDSIIISAIQIMDQQGIQGLTIRKLAESEGITEAAIYRHFSSKQEILLAVLEQYAYYDRSIRDTIIKRELNAKDALVFFMNSYSEYYENYPAITALVFSYDVFKYDAMIAENLKEINYKRREFIGNVIERGQANGEIKSDISSDDLVNMILGLIKEITSIWRQAEHSFSLKDKVLSTTGTLLNLI